LTGCSRKGACHERAGARSDHPGAPSDAEAAGGKAQLRGLARQANDGGWAYQDYLRELLEAEVVSRRDRAAASRLREAHFPEVKTLDQVDWQALSGVSRPKILELASCEYLKRAEAVVLAGPIGTGKTHLAIALGVEAARRRFRVLFTRAADLVRTLREARDERSLGQLHRRLQRADLLLVDELGGWLFERIAELYRLEREIRLEAGADATSHLTLRQQRAGPLLDQIRQWGLGPRRAAA
jgi:hypothetical protein